MWGIPDQDIIAKAKAAAGKAPKLSTSTPIRRKYVVTALRGDLTVKQLDEKVRDLLESAGLSGLTAIVYEPASNSFARLVTDPNQNNMISDALDEEDD